MDPLFLGGLLLALLGIVVAMLIDGNSLGPLIGPSSFMLVFFGALGAGVMAYRAPSCPRCRERAEGRRARRPTSRTPSPSSPGSPRSPAATGCSPSRPGSRSSTTASCARGAAARRRGRRGGRARDPRDRDRRDRRAPPHAIGFFKALGGYAPTFGMVGTVIGLINMLGNLSDPSQLGAGWRWRCSPPSTACCSPTCLQPDRLPARAAERGRAGPPSTSRSTASSRSVAARARGRSSSGSSPTCRPPSGSASVTGSGSPRPASARGGRLMAAGRPGRYTPRAGGRRGGRQQPLADHLRRHGHAADGVLRAAVRDVRDRRDAKFAAFVQGLRSRSATSPPRAAARRPTGCSPRTRARLGPTTPSGTPAPVRPASRSPPPRDERPRPRPRARRGVSARSTRRWRRRGRGPGRAAPRGAGPRGVDRQRRRPVRARLDRDQPVGRAGHRAPSPTRSTTSQPPAGRGAHRRPAAPRGATRTGTCPPTGRWRCCR
jgi:hypothetical protein